MSEISKVEEIIGEALGEASVLFMSQEVKGTEIVMPSEGLSAIAKRTAARITEGCNCEKSSD